ncbi:MAG: oligosaccharide flippase family protein, partial [Bacteroidales bacterium]|nr:oligosaccharide flippase family protein [Bacteroidales bacterium]
MGIIKRQSIKGSIYSYIGVVLGFVNLALLAPKIFTTEQIGLAQVLLSISTIAAQFATLGFNSVTSRLFPFFRSKNADHNGFLFLQSIFGLLGFSLVVILYFLFRDLLVDRNIEKSPLLVEYIYLIIPLVLFLLSGSLMDSFNRILYNATLGTFLKEILVRLGNLFIILLFFFDVISFQTYIFMFVGILALPSVLITIYLVITGKFSLRPKLKFVKPALRKEIIRVAIFGIIAGMSGIALVNIDKYMVSEYMGLSYAGIYSIAFYFGTLILIPARAISKISITVLAESWKDNNISIIESIYQKSCKNQFLIGGILFVLLV